MDLDNLTKHQQTQLLKLWKQHPEIFCPMLFEVFDPVTTEILPFHLFEYQIDTFNALIRNNFNEIESYRQGGMSTLFAAYILWLVLFSEKQEIILIVANKTEMAQLIMQKIRETVDKLPSWVLTIIDRPSKSNMILSNGARIKSANIMSESLRGFTPTAIFIDEWQYCDHIDDFFMAAWPSLATGGKINLTSSINKRPHSHSQSTIAYIRSSPRFNHIKLHWYNDPRFNKDLSWVKQISKNNETRVKDVDPDLYSIMVNLGYTPTSPWYEDICNQFGKEWYFG